MPHDGSAQVGAEPVPAHAPAPSVFIFVPAYGEMMWSGTFVSLFTVQAALAQRGVGGLAATLAHSDIVELRNMATTLWYDAVGTSHMLQVDADMGFDADLVLDMLALDEPLVGAIYRQRNEKVAWAGSGLPRPDRPFPSGRVRDGKFLDVEGFGMGVSLIRRDCITAMLEKWPEMSDENIEGSQAKELLEARGIKRLIRCFDPMYVKGRGRLSEDISFCIRHRLAGGKVWASIAHDIEHFGKKAYRGSFLQHTLEEEARARFAEPEGEERTIILPATAAGLA
jgi:hypothetical protein